MNTPPNVDFVRVPTDEYLSLQKEVESLRSALMDPPPDVQEAVIKKLGLVSGEALDIANAQVESLRGDRDERRNIHRLEVLKLHAALDKARSALEGWRGLVGKNDPAWQKMECDAALDAIKECGL